MNTVKLNETLNENHINTVKKDKVLYWLFTILFILPLALSGLGFFLEPPGVVERMTHMGYPIYIIRFLGTAKILGAVAVLTGRIPRLKEWAYAGFTFNLLGGFYSHFRSGDGLESLPALIVLVFGALSYVYWNKMKGALE